MAPIPKKRGPGRPKGRAETKKVLLPLAPALLKLVDEAAERAELTRVEWLRRAAMGQLAQPDRPILPPE